MERPGYSINILDSRQKGAVLRWCGARKNPGMENNCGGFGGLKKKSPAE